MSFQILTVIRLEEDTSQRFQRIPTDMSSEINISVWQRQSERRSQLLLQRSKAKQSKIKIRHSHHWFDGTNWQLMEFLQPGSYGFSELMFNKSEFNLATYKRGLASVEEQLVLYKRMSIEEFQQPEFKGYGHKISKSVSENVSNESHPQQEDQGYVDSGCSRHMTGNMSYLSNFKKFDEGYVTFGGGAKGGRITGR
ncbi:hypothetical protein Tco_0318382 [Tanacetum coccineum]